MSSPQQRYAEIAAREQAATPGEWVAGNYEGHNGDLISKKAPEPDTLFLVYGLPMHTHVRDIRADMYKQGIANRDFVIHARADIPYLLDRIRRAEELLRDSWEHYKRLDYQPEADAVDAFLAGDGQHTTPADAGEGE